MVSIGTFVDGMFRVARRIVPDKVKWEITVSGHTVLLRVWVKEYNVHHYISLDSIFSSEYDEYYHREICKNVIEQLKHQVWMETIK